jgi:uroporphyrinogen-III decarboxylase
VIYDFTLDPYQDRIAESARRLEIARRFQEPDQVPVEISVGGSFFCSLFGVDIAEYHQDRALALEVQLRGWRWCFEELRDDRADAGIYLDIGPLAEGLIFGAEIVRPDNTSPWSRHILLDPSDAERLQVPDPETHPAVQCCYQELDKLREIARDRGVRLPVSGGLGIHPPLSAACALAGPERIYAWMYDCPEVVKRLFDKLFETFCRLVDYRDSREGRRTTSIGLADDHSAFISEQAYREFDLPYTAATYQRYGRGGRYLHADGPNDHLFSLYANELKLTEMDIGGFSDLAAAKAAMHGKTVIMGGLNCKDLYRDFETARPKIEQAVATGAPGGGYIFGVGGETYAGVNPDTLIRTVAHAQRISRRGAVPPAA